MAGGVRGDSQAFHEYLVPIVKGWSTEMAIEVASLGVQVHGGMGFIEETGAAQYYRDARILAIYEGTTAIQANDLVGRKTARDGGAVAKSVLAQVRRTTQELAAHGDPGLAAIGRRLEAGADALEHVIDYVVDSLGADIKGVFAGSVPYLQLAGTVLAGWQMGRAALAARQKLDARDGEAGFYEGKLASARFFADHILTRAPGMRDAIVEGGASVMALPEEYF